MDQLYDFLAKKHDPIYSHVGIETSRQEQFNGTGEKLAKVIKGLKIGVRMTERSSFLSISLSKMKFSVFQMLCKIKE